MFDYPIQAFPQETRDDIAGKFYDYFRRKRKSRLSYREAATLINYVSGPVPAMGESDAQDYTKPKVSGGGVIRPSDADVERIMRKHEMANEPHEWDAVFDELLYRISGNRIVENLTLMTFRDGLHDYSICPELSIGRTTYFEKRRGVLDQAGVIAVKLGVLDPWKY